MLELKIERERSCIGTHRCRDRVNAIDVVDEAVAGNQTSDAQRLEQRRLARPVVTDQYGEPRQWNLDVRDRAQAGDGEGSDAGHAARLYHWRACMAFAVVASSPRNDQEDHADPRGDARASESARPRRPTRD